MLWYIYGLSAIELSFNRLGAVLNHGKKSWLSEAAGVDRLAHLGSGHQ